MSEPYSETPAEQEAHRERRWNEQRDKLLTLRRLFNPRGYDGDQLYVQEDEQK